MCQHPPLRNRRADQFGGTGANHKKNNDFIISAAIAGTESTESACAKLWHSLRWSSHLAV
jgi:hypothetical protein